MRFNLTKLFYYIQSTLVSFVLGIYIAGMLGVGEGQMLAAAAIVLGWGLMFAVATLILSLIFINPIGNKAMKKVNWILLLALLILYGITHLNYLKRKKEKSANWDRRKPTPLVFTSHVANFQQPMMGIGFFQPNFYEHPTLNFYGGVNLEKSIDEHLPQDSLVFEQTELGFTSTYAPPWLYPEHMKLDYGILMFRVVGYGSDFLKVESNKQTHQYHYVDKQKGRFITWPEMLLSVSTVEPLNGHETVRIKPLSNASTINLAYDFLKPLLVQGDWLYVKMLDDGFNEIGKGWIRWKDNDMLLITYSLLS